jgi:hypothetical protein
LRVWQQKFYQSVDKFGFQGFQVVLGQYPEEQLLCSPRVHVTAFLGDVLANFEYLLFKYPETYVFTVFCHKFGDFPPPLLQRRAQLRVHGLLRVKLHEKQCLWLIINFFFQPIENLLSPKK